MKAYREITTKAFEIYPYNGLRYVVVSRGNKVVSSIMNRRFKKYAVDASFEDGEEPYFVFPWDKLLEVQELLRAFR